MNPKVSVIVPVYNTQDYLADCLESLLSQSLSDIEIICIDDASTDQSYDILYKYSELDQRIRLYRNNENIGVGETRNKGIEYATGEYLYFIDSDDMLAEHALKTINKEMDSEQLDICFFKLNIIYESNKPMENDIIKKEGIRNSYDGIYTGYELFSSFIDNGEFFYYPCIAMLKKAFIDRHNLRFSKLKIGEGGLFIVNALIRANRAAFFDERLYNYRIRPSSATTSLGAELHSTYGSFIQYAEILRLLANESSPQITQALKKYLDLQSRKIKNLLSNRPEFTIHIDENIDSDYYRHIFSELCLPRRRYFNGFDDSQKESILNAAKVIIYGAGVASLDVLTALNELGKQIVGFAVTRNAQSPVSLYGHHVYTINELIDYAKDALVIVTANSYYRKEIENNLNNLGFKRYLFLDIIV